MTQRVRKNFIEAVESQNNKRKSLTENSAVAYATSGKNLLDFNFMISQYRFLPDEEIQIAFTKVYFEDPALAVKFLFFVGDVREGLGERKIFRACMDWLATNKPEVALCVLSLIPEYTRWDNLIRLINNINVSESVYTIIAEQFSTDIFNMAQNKPISLLAKWMPSINTSSATTRENAKRIIKALRLDERTYRKSLSALRKYLDVVEVKTSAKAWSEINYETVPSQANIKYKNAFMKHDEERRVAYLKALQSGNTKINASVTQPHEIVYNYSNNLYFHRDAPYDATFEEMWKALPDIVLKNTLVVRDGSGSMTCKCGDTALTCLDVATALTIYCSEHNSPAWKDKFITFSSHPSIVDLSHCDTLLDKLRRCKCETDCSNTNIYATMQLILDTAIENHFTQEDMPENILIISDMQFDGRYNAYFNWNNSLFDDIALQFEEAGYKLPKMIFWNLYTRSKKTSTIPMQENELGLILCSGFSINIMKMFMSGEINPYNALIKQINSPRYDAVAEAIEQVLKKKS